MEMWFINGIKKQFIQIYIFLKPFFTWILGKFFKEEKVVANEIPIIINNRNRLSCLKRLIEALEIRGYKNIYVIDNASTYPPLIEYYEKEYPYKIFRLKHNVGHLSLWKTGIIKQFRRNFFVYTDPDIVPIEDCPTDFIKVFMDVLEKYPFVEKVGFGLKIDDLPDTFNKKEEVIRWESQFWKRKLKNKLPLYRACIDTTFALYRPWVFSGGNLSSPHIRLGAPYIARHLPWYNDSNNLDAEEIYYLKSCKTASYLVGNSKLK